MSDKHVIFHIDGGAGKSIMATAVCTSIKAHYPDHKIVVVTAWPEVFLHNPDVYRVYKMGNFAYFYEDFVKDKNSVILRLDPYQSGEFINQSKHLIQIWCEMFNVPCVSTQPRLYLTQRELLNAAKIIDKKGPILLMQTHGGAEGGDGYYSWARDIPQSFAQGLVSISNKAFSKILHIRKENQPTLEGTVSITDNLRNLFCYVYFADKLILIDSMIQHVAAALQKPAAVAWIANTPKVFGYQLHHNIGPQQKPSYRHLIDSYMEECDWVGRRFYECPYDDIDNIFAQQPFVDYLNSSNLKFDEMPEKSK
jgi:hypothetical protein